MIPEESHQEDDYATDDTVGGGRASGEDEAGRSQVVSVIL